MSATPVGWTPRVITSSVVFHSRLTTLVAGAGRVTDLPRPSVTVIGPELAEGAGRRRRGGRHIGGAAGGEQGDGQRAARVRRLRGRMCSLPGCGAEPRRRCRGRGRTVGMPVAGSSDHVDADLVDAAEQAGVVDLCRACRAAATRPRCSRTIWSAMAAAWLRSCSTTPIGDAVVGRRGRGSGRGVPPGSAGRGRWWARRAAARRCPGPGRRRATLAGPARPRACRCRARRVR